MSQDESGMGITRRDLANHYKAKFANLTKDEIFRIIREALSMSVECWFTLAYAFWTLEDQGVPEEELLEVVDRKFLGWCRKISSGQLAPEAICRFWKDQPLVNLIGRLSPAKQMDLANGKEVQVVVLDDNGVKTVREKRPEQLTTNERKLVFAPDHIRSRAEQESILDNDELFGAKMGADTIGPLRLRKSIPEAITIAANRVVTLEMAEMLVAALRKRR